MDRIASTAVANGYRVVSAKSPGSVCRNEASICRPIRYALEHWSGLTRFLDDGRLEVDTNTVERTMRSVGLGRKNHLFAGSQGGAETWAVLASLIETARLNGLDPERWLRDVTGRIVSGRTRINRIDELLAWNWRGTVGGELPNAAVPPAAAA